MNIEVNESASYWCLFKTGGIHNMPGEEAAARQADLFPNMVVFQAELVEPIDPQFVLKLTGDVKGLEERLRETYKAGAANGGLLAYQTDSTKPVSWWKRWRRR